MGGPTSELVGRSRETGRLDGVLTGDLRALVVEGDAGVGKTALLDDFGRRVQAAGWSVARYQCVEAERDFPYATLDQILRPLADCVDALADHQRRAVDIVLGRTVGEAPAVMALGTAVLGLLVRASDDCPRAVIVDDAHWMDSASGQVLMFVARRLGGAPVCVLLGVRAGEPTDLEVAGIEHLDLRPLDPASAAELLDTRHPGLSAEVRAEALRWAVGNPLALTELPASLAARSPTASRSELPLPRRLEQVYAQRLDRLPEDERFALLLLALDGVIDADGAHGLPHPLPAAEAAGLVDRRRPGSRASFRHPLVLSAVVGSARPEQARAAHLKLAEVRAGDPLRRAHHLAGATDVPDETIAHEVQLGAEHAIHRGGAAVAMQLLVRAAALSERADRRERRLADAAFVATHAGLLDEAAALVGRLDRLHGDLVAPSTLLTDGTLQLYRHGAVGPTHRAVLDMVRRRGHDLDDETLRRLVALLLPLCMYSADPDLWERTEPMIDEYADRLTPVTLLVRDVGGDLLRHAAGARDRVAEAFTWSGSTTFDVTLLALCAYFVDSLGEHRPLVDRMVEREAEAGSLTDVMTLLHLILLDETVRGRWDDAAKTVARGLELSARLGNEMFSYLYRAFYARVLAQRGDVTGARELGLAVDLWARPRGLGVLVQHVEVAALAGSLAVGAYDTAWTHALGLISPGSFRPYAHESFRCVLDVVEAGMASGHVDEARRHAEAAVAQHVSAVSPRMDMLCTAALAITDATAEAGRLFEVATGHPAAPVFPFDHARISLAYGRWLRRRRDLAGARIALKRAVDLFEDLGSPPWTERASHELSLAGAAGADLTRLTAQELRIAELAASGLTNRQIGAQLYLSPRTVATHLYRTFPKLGVTSRAALRDALAGGQSGEMSTYVSR
ncbi:LuxR family transcriptional regulator [Paractinoplanes ferrugineus]|uniref:LuxR family transcriptional regulator n=1 Tax=Paractinoplanes ferrugineus TaxID=113564 RepID=A0A919J5W5_9ACTN|nr:LuxR family transcriptional regulator [Actinoplanes ferrugineus]GIE13588.1 LuxR family transcriptional regulator [Actinoplanes ferrugineus]